MDVGFLSTPSARRATQQPLNTGNTAFISIHALREEGDTAPQPVVTFVNLFLSTPSARRATFFATGTFSSHWDFYPRPPRGGRLPRLSKLAECVLFLSTPSARRATKPLRSCKGRHCISIHALREEGDLGKRLQHLKVSGGFLSTPSARRATARSSGRAQRERHFYPRPPRGGRLFLMVVSWASLAISIHALREEGDPFTAGWMKAPFHFYPRPPRGGRRVQTTAMPTTIAFLSTPSARRATLTLALSRWPLMAFLSTPSARRATRPCSR